MAERLGPEPGLLRVDVRKFMDDAPDFWSDVSLANIQLSAFARSKDMSAEDKAREAKIVEDFNDKYFGLPWLERPARFTVAYEDGPEGEKPQLGIDTQDGKFVACIAVKDKDTLVVDRDEALFVKKMGHKALAFKLTTASGMIYPIPINRGILDLSVDIPNPVSAERTFTDALKNYGERFTHILHTDVFLNSDLDSQKVQIENMLHEAEQKLDITSAEERAFEVVVENSNDASHPTRLSGNHIWLMFPDAPEREIPYRNHEDFVGGDELCIAIQMTGSDKTQVIPVSYILDIIDLNEWSIADNETDILGRFFEEPRIRNQIYNMEEYITSREDAGECSEAIKDAIENLRELTGPTFFDQTFSVKGRIFHEDEHGDLVPSEAFEARTGATGTDFDIREVDGEYRVVIPLVVNSGDNEEGWPTVEHFYIVPDGDYTSRLVGRPKEVIIRDIEEINIVDEFKDCYDIVNELVRSYSFKKAPRKEQCRMISEALQPINIALEQVSSDADDTFVECSVSEYWQTTPAQEHLTYAQIAKLPKIVPDKGLENTPLVLRGNRMLVVVPETTDQTIPKFHGPFSFPLSHGTPMLILEDTEKWTTYFIPLKSISGMVTSAQDRRGE